MSWLKKLVFVVSGFALGVLVSMRVVRRKRRPTMITRRTLEKMRCML